MKTLVLLLLTTLTAMAAERIVTYDYDEVSQALRASLVSDPKIAEAYDKIDELYGQMEGMWDGDDMNMAQAMKVGALTSQIDKYEAIVLPAERAKLLATIKSLGIEYSIVLDSSYGMDVIIDHKGDMIDVTVKLINALAQAAEK